MRMRLALARDRAASLLALTLALLHLLVLLLLLTFLWLSLLFASFLLILLHLQSPTIEVTLAFLLSEVCVQCAACVLAQTQRVVEQCLHMWHNCRVVLCWVLPTRALQEQEGPPLPPSHLQFIRVVLSDDDERSHDKMPRTQSQRPAPGFEILQSKGGFKSRCPSSGGGYTLRQTVGARQNSKVISPWERFLKQHFCTATKA